MRKDTQETRRRIIDTAERLFAERGVEITSLVEIAKAAGQKNRSALQYHFTNKEGLLNAVRRVFWPAALAISTRLVISTPRSANSLSAVSIIRLRVSWVSLRNEYAPCYPATTITPQGCACPR